MPVAQQLNDYPGLLCGGLWFSVSCFNEHFSHNVQAPPYSAGAQERRRPLATSIDCTPLDMAPARWVRVNQRAIHKVQRTRVGTEAAPLISSHILLEVGPRR